MLNGVKVKFGKGKKGNTAVATCISSSITMWSGGSDPIYILVFERVVFLVTYELLVVLCISELSLNRRGL